MADQAGGVKDSTNRSGVGTEELKSASQPKVFVDDDEIRDATLGQDVLEDAYLNPRNWAVGWDVKEQQEFKFQLRHPKGPDDHELH